MTMHPEAKKNIDNKGNDLLGYLIGFQVSYGNVTKTGMPELYISGDITDQDIIGEIGVEILDPASHEPICKYVKTRNGNIGLANDGYKELEKLAVNIQKQFRRVASYKYLLDKTFFWIIESFRKRINITLANYIEEQIGKDVVQQDIWIPIAYLQVKNDFAIGGVVFKPITEQFFSDSLQKLTAKTSQHNDSIIERYNKLKKPYLGLAAATVSITAENTKACEVAMEMVEEALALIHMFTPGALYVKRQTFSLPKNISPIGTINCLFVQEGIIANSKEERLAKPEYIAIDNEFIEKIPTELLSNYVRIINNDSLSKFESKVLDTILLYSKAITSKELSEKIIYIFSALEGLLIRDDNEPIIQNLSERIAFWTADKPEERLKIIRTFKEVYGIRSRFVHHGIYIQHKEILEEFITFVWIFFIKTLTDGMIYNTKEEFINTIERIKLS